ncbi:hypothetical protein M0R89_19445 (plasmid) [Halorussus limi]|uniref:DUF7344 domain-containing protein n=1 Tax=Halorussus limi TaxID=2938695 RepID=A0A8U0HZH3_9EURY|nr:hypothetical protein [Halorussus limi]UPV76338.1 hypothetical protein M0R89_19445 [Halorussus limi]
MESTTTPRSTDAQSLDAVLSLLRKERRRHVLAVLSERNGPVSVRDLAAAVAARETEGDAGEISPETTGSVAATLHHVHLPKLADADAVAYDDEAGTATLAQAEGFTPFLGLADEAR